MAYLLIENADHVATFDASEREMKHCSILVEDQQIVAIDSHDVIAKRIGRDSLPIERTIDASGHVVLPGLVNTHHHFYQTLTRNVPRGQDAELFDWLVTHYPIWARMDASALRHAAQVATCELLLSGCTTAADHTYLWPNGARIDDEIEAVSELGIRFHCSRGSMSLGESDGGLPPDSVVESEAAIIRDTTRAIEEYHDPDRFSMTRIVVAPCSPFSVSERLMRDSQELARAHKVHLHTHLAETRDEEAFCVEQMGCTPVEFAERVGWSGEDVWFAHMVHPHQNEIDRLGAARCGCAHCATSNMRLGSGIAPILAMEQAGMRVGIGVDGSASNDGSNLLAEARQAMLLQRLAGHMHVGARHVLRLATRGGASVLGRDDIGSLAPGMAADIIGYRTDSLGLAGGAVHDPLAALVFCQTPTVSFSVINGVRRIEEGSLVGVDLTRLVQAHNQAAVRLVAG